MIKITFGEPNKDRGLGSLAQIPVLLCIYFFTAILPLLDSKRLLIGFSHSVQNAIKSGLQ